jgi:hypothetical protein
MKFKNVTDDNLLCSLKKLAADECKLLREVIEYLEEVESRKLYLKRA